MVTASYGQPVFYYAAPSKPAALYDRGFVSIGAVAKFLQGAGTALLAYTGAGNLTGASGAGVPGVTDFTTIDGFTQAMLEGRLTGPAQLIAGAFLFIAAGRCNARMLGLFAGLALVFFYSQGVTLAEMIQIGGDLVGKLVAAAAAFGKEAIALS